MKILVILAIIVWIAGVFCILVSLLLEKDSDNVSVRPLKPKDFSFDDNDASVILLDDEVIIINEVD